MEEIKIEATTFKRLFLGQILTIIGNIAFAIINQFVDNPKISILLIAVIFLFLIISFAGCVMQIVELMICRKLNKRFRIAGIVAISYPILSLIGIIASQLSKSEVIYSISGRLCDFVNMATTTLIVYGIIDIAKEMHNDALTAKASKSAAVYVIFATIAYIGNIFVGSNTFDGTAIIVVVIMEIITYGIYLNLLHKAIRTL